MRNQERGVSSAAASAPTRGFRLRLAKRNSSIANLSEKALSDRRDVLTSDDDPLILLRSELACLTQDDFAARIAVDRDGQLFGDNDAFRVVAIPIECSAGHGNDPSMISTGLLRTYLP